MYKISTENDATLLPFVNVLPATTRVDLFPYLCLKKLSISLLLLLLLTFTLHHFILQVQKCSECFLFQSISLLVPPSGLPQPKWSLQLTCFGKNKTFLGRTLYSCSKETSGWGKFFQLMQIIKNSANHLLVTWWYP